MVKIIGECGKASGRQLLDSEPFVVPWDYMCFKGIPIEFFTSTMCVYGTGGLPLPLSAPLNIQYCHTQYLTRVRNIKSWDNCEESTSFGGSIAHGNFLGLSVHRNSNSTWLIAFPQVILEKNPHRFEWYIFYSKANKERVKVTKCGAEKFHPLPSQLTASQTSRSRLLLFDVSW